MKVCGGVDVWSRIVVGSSIQEPPALLIVSLQLTHNLKGGK